MTEIICWWCGSIPLCSLGYRCNPCVRQNIWHRVDIKRVCPKMCVKQNSLSSDIWILCMPIYANYVRMQWIICTPCMFMFSAIFLLLPLKAYSCKLQTLYILQSHDRITPLAVPFLWIFITIKPAPSVEKIKCPNIYIRQSSQKVRWFFGDQVMVLNWFFLWRQSWWNVDMYCYE